MKKVLLALLFFAICLGGVFAQAAPAPAPALKVEALFDAYFVPFQYVNRTLPDLNYGTISNKTTEVSQMGMGLGRDSGTQASPRFRLLMTSSGSQYIGFTFTIQFMLDRQAVYSPDVNVSGANGGGVNNAVPGANSGPQNPGISSVFSGFDGNAHVWWKPFGDDMLNIRVGFYEFDDLRGKIGDPPWIRQFALGGTNADAIFTRFHNNGNSGYGYGAGVLFTSKPIPDLLIGLNFKGLIPFQGSTRSGAGIAGDLFEMVNYNNGANELTRVLERTQIGAGYTIKDIGLARIQYLGANNYFTKPGTFDLSMNGIPSIAAPAVEVAFQVLALESMGLMLDIGFKLPFSATAENSGSWVTSATNITSGKTEYVYDWVSYNTKDYEFTAQPAYQLSLGARWRTTIGEGPTNNLNINARFDTKFGGSVEVIKWNGQVLDPAQNKLEFPFEINAHVWPTYNLGFATVGLDIGFNYVGEYEMDGKVPGKGAYNSATVAYNGEGMNGGIRVGFAAWIQKEIMANNSVQIGLSFKPKAEMNGVYEDMVFTIPVTFASRF